MDNSIRAIYDEKNAIFIDRNPTYFNHILDYLRSFKSKIIFNPKILYFGEALDEFIEEAEFYQMNSLIDLIKSKDSDQEIIIDEDEEEQDETNTSESISETGGGEEITTETNTNSSIALTDAEYLDAEYFF